MSRKLFVFGFEALSAVGGQLLASLTANLGKCILQKLLAVRGGVILCSLFIFHLSFAREIVINEIGWMGTDHSAYDEWIELYNPGSVDQDLTGWHLTAADGSPDIALSGVIKADDFFVLERTDDTTLSIMADQIYAGSLSNDGEELFLRNAAGLIVDQTPNGTWVGGINTSPKQSLERINAFSGTGSDGGNWATTEVTSALVQDARGNPVLGTPGAYNSVSPPKPQSVVEFVPNDFQLTVLKVAPTSLGTTKEWLSFLIQSDQAVDLTDWSIRRGTTTKKFADLRTDLVWNTQHFPHGNVSGQTINFVNYPSDRLILLPQNSPANSRWLIADSAESLQGIITLTPSPVTLPDSGGTIEILNEKNEVVSAFTYPTTKKGTRSGQAYAEIWHQDPSGEIFPLLAWEGDDLTAWQTNFTLTRPTLPENIQLQISEISLSNGDKPDFIELYLAQAPAVGANLKDLQITQNGTEVLRLTADTWVQTGDFLVVVFGNKNFPTKSPPTGGDLAGFVHLLFGTGKASLADSNGTLTVRLWAGTSWETVEDFWCWVKPNQLPSNAMLGRIDAAGLEVEQCFEIDEKTPEQMSWARDFLPKDFSAPDVRANGHSLLPNDNITDSRQLNADSHSKKIKRHYLGSPGQMNYWPNPANLRPQAHIFVQTTTATSINVSGDKSYDPNGDFDIRQVQWQLRQKQGSDTTAEVLSDKLNPSTFNLDFIKTWTEENCRETELSLELKVWDFHRSVGKKTLVLPLHWDEDHCSLGRPKSEKITLTPPKFLAETHSDETAKDFFADVLPILKTVYTETSSQVWSDGFISNHDETVFEPNELVTARDTFFATYPQLTPSILRKNIGWAVYGGR